MTAYDSPSAAPSQTTPAQKYVSTTESMLQTTSTHEYESPTAILAQSTTPQKYGSSSTHYPLSQSSFHTVPSTIGGFASHAVSRLPPSTLNDLSDLDVEVKTPVYHTTLGILLPNEGGNAHTTHHPEFVDLTETTTAQPPPTNVMEYTLDFNVEDRPTVTEHVYGTATGPTSFGEVTDVTVSNVASAIASSSTEPFSTPRPSTTTKKLKTRSPTMTQTKARPSTAASKPIPTKPRPPSSPTTISNDIQHVTYPSKATLWPSTVFKMPLRTTLGTRPAQSTLFTSTATVPVSTDPVHLTSTTPQTTSTLPKRTKKPTKSTTTMVVSGPIPVKTTMSMTTATKPKSTPKPTKPVLAMPSRPAKPTKTPLPSKSPTKKSTPKPPSKIPPPLSTFTHASTTSVKPTMEPVVNGTGLPTATSSQQWDYRKHCGVRPLHPQGRIVGGRNSFIGEWPWQVLVKEATWLGLFIKNKCGGVLISDKYALTAAHCQPG
ncbi:mucin-2-like [Dermacentor silvarum]|uniref:mucin-2-like n=1 Tax=Dermacentor silvarum TaxID=543639 RepID=UPI00189B0F1D|nr:mucin-2-like [Dermacentor silvarum]